MAKTTNFVGTWHILGTQNELNLGLKTEKQFQNKNLDWALGDDHLDNGHINY